MAQSRIILTLLTVFLLSSCANPQFQKDYASSFASCRGFDFDKKFPWKEGDLLGVDYDWILKRDSGIDGLYFTSKIKRPISSYRIYNPELDLSEKEKKYIRKFDAREKAFDEKYTQAIKDKVKKATPIITMHDGRKEAVYPSYLAGDELPEGLVSPTSLFSPIVIAEYARAEKKNGDLQKFILSTEIYKDSLMWELSYILAHDARSQIISRLDSLYTEYVLAWYLLNVSKMSLEEREETVNDLSDYYSDVAFRAAAESLYRYRRYLTESQRCRFANYVAGRVRELVMAINNPQRLEEIKKEYSHEILSQCNGYLHDIKILIKTYTGELTVKDAIPLAKQLKKDVFSGKERCIND